MTTFFGRRVRLMPVAAAVAGLIALTAPAGAQDVSINFAQGSGLTERVLQMVALLTVLSLAPSILVMMTSFTPHRGGAVAAAHRARHRDRPAKMR